MKKYLFFLLIITNTSYAQKFTEKDFKTYFDAYGLKGSFLLYDLKNGDYVTYDSSRCRQGFLPASTFKIPNTIIALESGIVRDTLQIFRWEGKKWPVEAWNHDMTLAEAIRTSCAPCFQQIARKVGAYRYKMFLDRFGYANFVVEPDSVEWFWLQGSARISQFQEIDFLRKLILNQLPVDRRSIELTKELLFLNKERNWKLFGKTGWASPTFTGIEGWGNDPDDYGWFVGWLEEDGDIYIFATAIEATRPVPDSFGKARRAITEAILKKEFNLLK
ncbi:MAG: penicillin-binding transpeptidase domain-containing protein [Siphonobacter sp.]